MFAKFKLEVLFTESQVHYAKTPHEVYASHVRGLSHSVNKQKECDFVRVSGGQWANLYLLHKLCD